MVTVVGENDLARTVKWITSDTSIVRVNSNTGLVTGVAPGTATIIVTPIVDVTRADTVVVTVPPPSVVSVSIVPDSVEIDSTIALVGIVTVISGASDSVIWSSLDTSKATVDSTGMITGKSAGMVTIYCHFYL